MEKSKLREAINIKCLILVAAEILAALVLLGIWMDMQKVDSSEIEITVLYGEFHANRDGGTSQLFWTGENEAFSEDHSVMCDVSEMLHQVTFQLPKLDLEHTRFRLDPFLNSDEFSIASVSVWRKDECLLTISGTSLPEYISEVENLSYELGEGVITVFYPETEDPIIYLEDDLGEMILPEYLASKELWREKSQYLFGVILFVYAALGTFLFGNRKPHDDRRMTWKHLMAMVFADAAVCVGLLFNYVVLYLIERFGDVGMEELLFYLNMPITGTNVKDFSGAIGGGIGIVVCATVAVFLVDKGLRRHGRDHGYVTWLWGVGVLLTGYAFVVVYHHFEMEDYLAYMHEETTIYEDYYVDGKEVGIAFPDEKRNLIYIFLESMETTYGDVSSGGAMETNIIPELTALSIENINFSGNMQKLNGPYMVSGANFTTGGLVAQTSGVPVTLSQSLVNDAQPRASYLLPGAKTLGDVLADEGYRQVFMLGSSGWFGARSPYFVGHGDFEIVDYDAAIRDAMIPEDYNVWWGFEDTKLFAFAKEELLSLAAEEEPFNFMMLTADTHFTDGYLCELCGDEYDSQYSNVMACSSRQVAEFVGWIQQQDFYENTTIIIIGDHLTMDSAYIEKARAGNYDRKIYFALIHPADGCEEPIDARVYSSLDIYPTTLAALGAKIEGDRLGLGVNLFSDIPTLVEEYSLEYVNAELLKYSNLYESELIY